ncbi:MAG: hypothetical protein ABIU54_03145 [Candidatus Eisenbacteria bacterium]
MRRTIAVAGLALSALIVVANQPNAFPGGTPRLVTNMTPQCAGCHSSVNAEQVRDMPADAAAGYLADKQHFEKIKAGERSYAKLTPEDRDKLIANVKTMEANSHAEMVVSATRVKSFAPLTVTVKTHGGAGPVVGVMLTDNDLRFSSSPIQAAGFLITMAPIVIGPDGNAQTQFLDGRYAGLGKNINFVNISGVKGEVETGAYQDCSVKYALRAPVQAGTYTIAAAFLFGTEKGSALGRTEAPGGRTIPAGGGGAGSGRILFTKPITIKVTK